MEENLEGLCCDIYPREYELKVEHYSDHATFLNQDTTTEQGILIFFWPYLGWTFSGLLRDGAWGEGVGKKAPLHKICHTNPAMMKLSTIIPCLKKIQIIYESRDTPHCFCLHQHFFTRNQQILLLQEIQI